MISDEQIHFGMETLSSQKKREFNYDEFENHASDVFGELKIQNMDTRALLFCLFDVGAIGNESETRHSVLFTLKYRNPVSRINFQERFTIHKGLWKAFNLV